MSKRKCKTKLTLAKMPKLNISISQMDKRRSTRQEEQKKDNIVATIDLSHDDDNLWGNEEDDLLLSQVQVSVSDMPLPPKHCNNYNMAINSHSVLQNVTFNTFAKEKMPTSTQNYRYNNDNQHEYDIELNNLTIDKNNVHFLDSQNIRTKSILQQLRSTASTSQLNTNSQVQNENEIKRIAENNRLQSIKEKNELCGIIDNLSRQISVKDMELKVMKSKFVTNPKRHKLTNSQDESLKSIQMTNTELSHSFRIKSIIECFDNNSFMEINSNLLQELAKPFNGNELELLTKSENLLLFQLKQLQNILFLSVCGDKNIQKYIDEIYAITLKSVNTIHNYVRSLNYNYIKDFKSIYFTLSIESTTDRERKKPTNRLLSEKLKISIDVLNILSILCKNYSDITVLLFDRKNGNLTIIEKLIEILKLINSSKEIFNFYEFIESLCLFLINATSFDIFTKYENRNEQLKTLFKHVILCYPNITATHLLTDLFYNLSKFNNDFFITCIQTSIKFQIIRSDVYNIQQISTNSCPILILALYLQSIFKQYKQLSTDFEINMLFKITYNLLKYSEYYYNYCLLTLILKKTTCRCYIEFINAIIILFHLCLKNWKNQFNVSDMRIIQMGVIFLYNVFKFREALKVSRDFGIKNRVKYILDWIQFHISGIQFQGSHTYALNKSIEYVKSAETEKQNQKNQEDYEFYFNESKKFFN